MANAQVLIQVRSTVDLSPGSQIQAIVEAAARAAGFTPGPWTFVSTPTPVAPVASGGGVVNSGPWGPTATFPATTVGETIRPTGMTLFFNTYRQNLLNGPEPTRGETSTPWPFPSAIADAMAASLRALPGVTGVRAGYRSPSTVIAWDRGIPAPISLVATAPPQNFGALWGLLAIAGLAFVASRGSAAKTTFGRLSTNREGLTFEEWRRAAGVKQGTPGIHAAWAKGEDPTEWRAHVQRAATVASRTSLMGSYR